MNNSVYGKTMKNLTRTVKVRVGNNAKDYKKYVSKPSFVPQKIINKRFVVIHEIKPVLAIGKSIHVEITFLMYEFHYKYMQLKYGNLLFTYTDSLVYEILRVDVY